MKICWDNLHKIEYIDNNTWRYRKRYQYGITTRLYIYMDNCRNCNQPYLTYKNTSSEFCSPSCAKQGEWHPNHGKKRPEHSKKMKEKYINGEHVFCNMNFSGKDNPMYDVHRFGEDSPNWKGGPDSLLCQIYNWLRYEINWYSDVKEKDNYTCQICGIRKGPLNSHHIQPVENIVRIHNIESFNDAKQCEILKDLNNGMCLCENCHLKIIHPWQRRERKNNEQLVCSQCK